MFFGILKPEALEKKPGVRADAKKIKSRSRLEKKSGAGAAKKLPGSSALLVIVISMHGKMTQIQFEKLWSFLFF